MFVNYEKSEINAKLFYFGSAGAGKSTNVKYIYRRLNPEIRGKLNETAAPDGVKTISFDFLPANLGDIGGFKVRFQIYAVSGGDISPDTLRTILKNTDGVVFVVDSGKRMFEKNRECEANLENALASLKKTLRDVPCAIQYNKRDLPDAADLEELYKAFNRKDTSFYQAVAAEGKNVMETLTAICRMTIKKLKERFQRSRIKDLGNRPKPAGQELSSMVPDNYTDEALKMVDDLDVFLQSDSAKPATPVATPAVKLKLPEPSKFKDGITGEEDVEMPVMEFDLSELNEEELEMQPLGSPGAKKADAPSPAEPLRSVEPPPPAAAQSEKSEFDLSEIIGELDAEDRASAVPPVTVPPEPLEVPAVTVARPGLEKAVPAEDLSIDLSSVSFSGGLLEIPVRMKIAGSEKIVKLKVRLELGEVEDV